MFTHLYTHEKQDIIKTSPMVFFIIKTYPMVFFWAKKVLFTLATLSKFCFDREGKELEHWSLGSGCLPT